MAVDPIAFGRFLEYFREGTGTVDENTIDKLDAVTEFDVTPVYKWF